MGLFAALKIRLYKYSSNEGWSFPGENVNSKSNYYTSLLGRRPHIGEKTNIQVIARELSWKIVHLVSGMATDKLHRAGFLLPRGNDVFLHIFFQFFQMNVAYGGIEDKPMPKDLTGQPIEQVVNLLSERIDHFLHVQNEWYRRNQETEFNFEQDDIYVHLKLERYPDGSSVKIRIDAKNTPNL